MNASLLRLALAGLVCSASASASATTLALHMPTCSAAPFFTGPPVCPRLWEVRMTPDKGRGLFAVVDIAQGTRLLTEAPLVVVQPPPIVPGRGFELAAMLPPVQAAFAGLAPAQQQRYLACHEVRFGEEGRGEQDGKDDSVSVSGGRLLRILRSNAYTTQDGRIGLYPDVALINHDCRPNVLNTDYGGGGGSSDDNRQRVIVATRDIAAGDEIVTTYVPLLADTATRAARLTQYGFTCRCDACRSSSLNSAATTDDNQRVAMKRVLDDVKHAAQQRTPTAARASVDQAVELAEYIRAQGFADYGAQTSRLAAELALGAGRHATAAEWATIHLEDVLLASDVGGSSSSSESVEARQARALMWRIARKASKL